MYNFHTILVLQLQHFIKLETLHIDGFDDELTNEAFTDQLKTLPGLRSLSLRFASRRQMPPLAIYCPQLHHLSLENFEGTLNDVGDFPQLKSLQLRWRLAVHINSELFRTLALRYADRLEQLQLSKVLPNQVPYIVALRSLRLLACPMWPSEGLHHLKQLQKVECLVLQCVGPAVSVIQLLDIIKDCSKLQHLKFGKSWLQADLETFVCAVQDVLRQQTCNGKRKELLLTLDFDVTKELQNMVRFRQNLLRNLYINVSIFFQLKERVNSQFLNLDWQDTYCELCTPDRHTKHEAFLE